MLAADATFADIQAELAACSGYETDPTGDLGRRFLAAGRRLVAGGLPQSSTQGQSNVQFDIATLRLALEECRGWLMAGGLLSGDTSTLVKGARLHNLQRFRGYGCH